jgi:hypothetical protein
MEALFSTTEEPISIHRRIIPPKGVATFQKDFKGVKSVPSEPAWINTKIVSGTITDLEFSAKEELNDQEILMLASKSGSFSFWEDEEEDIYTEQDGTPIR